MVISRENSRTLMDQNVQFRIYDELLFYITLIEDIRPKYYSDEEIKRITFNNETFFSGVRIQILTVKVILRIFR